MARITARLRDYLVGEALGNLVGFGAGVAAHSLLKQFFVRKSLFNAWGLFSKRAAVSKDTLSWLEVGLTVLVGFVVFELVRWAYRQVRRAHPTAPTPPPAP